MAPKSDDVANALGGVAPLLSNDAAIVRPRIFENVHRAFTRIIGSLAHSKHHSINQRLFDTSLDLIFVVDRHGSFLRVSPSSSTILGYRPEEMIGHSATTFIHPDDLGNTRNEMRAARRGRLTRNFDTRYMHKNGRAVVLSWMGVWSPEDQQHFFIGRDITERIVADERLRRAQRLEAIGQLTGGVAHDFNNLLAVIIANLDVLRRLRKDDPQVAEFAGEAAEAAVRGADLTRQLLAFARRQPLRPERIDLNELVGGITKMLSRTLGEQIDIALELAPGIWPVAADPAQLEASLTNLATNARDAMPHGGRLMIVTGNRHLDADYAAQYPEAVPGDYVMLEVSDTGVGMPPEVASQIFEPFFTTKEDGKGTGLGLSMVFGYVKQSEGHISVYSEVGVGTTFRLYLPRDAKEATAQPRTTVDDFPLGRGETVLAVEDNAALRRIVAHQLRELGYRVFEAEHAAAAIAVLEREKVDLLFTDIVMPGKANGFDLARTAQSRWPSLRVLLTSGFPQARINSDLGAAPSDARILSKPYRREDLARALRELIEA
jgi:PAS domain S-box-containing protein